MLSRENRVRRPNVLRSLTAFSQSSQIAAPNGTPPTVASIDGGGPFREVLISLSFYEGQTHGRGEQASRMRVRSR
jgi:hypothetical protein